MSDTMKAAWMLVAGFIASVYAAFVSMCMWNWFATRALHVPEISFFGTLGLLWLVRLLTSSNSDERYEWAMFREVVEAAVSDEKREAVEKVKKAFTDKALLSFSIIELFGNTVTLVLGFLLHTFLV